MRLSRLALSAATALVLTGGVANAATITVNTTDDELNNDGDCSLREAVFAANANTDVDACTGGTGDDAIMAASAGRLEGRGHAHIAAYREPPAWRG